jgi:hypothetical protein
MQNEDNGPVQMLHFLWSLHSTDCEDCSCLQFEAV